MVRAALQPRWAGKVESNRFSRSQPVLAARNRRLGEANFLDLNSVFMSVLAIIPAAGVGVRMGGAMPKQFLSLEGVPIFVHTQ